MDSRRIFQGVVVFGTMAALLLMAIEVARHPASIGGYGRRLFITDIAILLLYGMAATLAWRQRYSRVALPPSASLWIAFAAGAVLATNHITEIFVANRPFALVIAPVLLMFALLGAAGSVSWERTRSFPLAALSGLWCAIIAMLVLLCFVLAFNLVFEHRAELWLHNAFVASRASDEGAFLVRNSLEAASEGLVRLPILALFLSFAGALVNAWMSGRSRKNAIAIALITPILFAVGLASLWYADTQERAVRPPFVLFGALSAAFALCCAHPVMSTLRRAER